MTKTTHTIVAALIAAAFTNNVAKADLTGSLETTAVSNYTYQGLKLDGNPVFIPKLNVQAALFEGGSLLFSAQQVVGTRGSALFRSQYDAGVSLNFNRFTFTPGYQVTAWSENSTQNTQLATARLSFDDGGLSPVALRPYVSVQAPLNQGSGAYYEVGVAPSHNYGKLNVSLPLALGVGSNGYYPLADGSGAGRATAGNETHYGFTSAGVALTYGVTDRLSLKASGTYFNTDSRLGNDKNNFITSAVGVTVSF
jgi:hypothetical protein